MNASTAARLRLALNANDHALLLSELQLFRSTILHEHGADDDSEHPFGYHGRSTLHPLECARPKRVLGVLKDYAVASPALDELLALWDRPGRDEDRQLAAVHTETVSVALFCAASDHTLHSAVVNVILRDHIKSIHHALSSGYTALVHATLGLLTMMCGSTSQSCIKVLGKLNLDSAAFTNLTQRGKQVSREVAGVRVDVDSRQLLAVLLFSIALNADEQSFQELVRPSSLIRKLLHSIGFDTPAGITTSLVCVLRVVQSALVSVSTRVQLVDGVFAERLVQLYAHDSEAVQQEAHAFLLALCGGLGKTEGGSLALTLVRRLTPWSEPRHKAIVEGLLRNHPSVLIPAIAAISMNWEPQPSYLYLNGLSYLLSLLAGFDWEGCFRWHLRKHVTDTSDSSARAIAFDKVLAELVPSGLAKKEFCRLLQSDVSLVQHTGFLLLSALLSRVQQLLRAIGINDFGHSDSAAFSRIVPDFQTVLNIRSKIVMEIASNTPRNTTQSDDDLLEVCALDLYEDTLQLLQLYYEVVPLMCLAANFDCSRLLDDAVMSSDVKGTVSNAATVLRSMQVFRCSLKVSNSNLLGNEDELVKLLTNCIVVKDWESAVKRSALTKLLLLTSSIDESISQAAKHLLIDILLSSGLFEGHGIVDSALIAELNVWVETCKQSLSSVLLIELLLRYASAWNISFAITAQQIYSESSASDCALAPISPVMFALLTIVCGDLSLCHSLPNHIKKHLSNGRVTSGGFFDKFLNGFYISSLSLFEHALVCRMIHEVHDSSYIRVIRTVCSRLLSGNAGMSELVFSVLDRTELAFLQSTEVVDSTATCISEDSLLSASSVAPLRHDVSSYLTASTDCRNAYSSLWMRCACLHLQNLIEVCDQTQLSAIHAMLAHETARCKHTHPQLRILTFQRVCRLLFSLMAAESMCNHEGGMYDSVASSAVHLIVELIRLSGCASSYLTIVNDCNLVDLLHDHLSPHIVKLMLQLSEMYRKFITPTSEVLHCIWERLYTALIDRVKNNEIFEQGSDMLRLLRCLSVIHPASSLASLLIQHSLDGVNMSEDLISVKHLKRAKSTNGVVSLARVDTMAGSMFEEFPSSIFKELISAFITSDLSATGSYFVSGVSTTLDTQMNLVSYLDFRSFFSQMAFTSTLTSDEWLGVLKVMGSCSISNLIDQSNTDSSTFIRCVLGTSASWARGYFTSTLGSSAALLSQSNNCLPLTSLSYTDLVAGFQLVLISFEDVAERSYFSAYLSLLERENALSGDFFLNAATVLCFPKRGASISVFESVILCPSLVIAMDRIDCTDATAVKAWINVFQKTLIFLLHSVITSVSGLHDSKERCISASAVTCSFLENIKFLISLQLNDSWAVELKSIDSTFLRKLLNKLVKTLLKHSLNEEDVFMFLSSLISQLDSQIMTVFNVFLYPTSVDSYSPSTILNMMLGHSKFISALSSNDSELGNLPLLRMILQIISFLTCTVFELESESVQILLESIIPLYKTTLAESDRIISRIVFLLSSHDRCPPLHLLLMSAGKTSFISFDWLASLSSMTMIYSSLANFPLDRCIFPPPFHIESEASKYEYITLLSSKFDTVVSKFQSSEKTDSLAPSLPHTDDLYEFVNFGSVYDPSFWVPAIHLTLSFGEQSIRTLASSGMLLQLFLSLGSICPITRAYALAALQLVHTYLRKQTADHDASFRERPQILLLVEFLRDSIDQDMCELSPYPPRVPPVIAHFLGKSSVHLLQPNHELFGKMNKYILSRPHCDMKDVPLYEFVVNDDAEDEFHDNELLMLLRILRDSLSTKDDHLNFCRKHIYTRLQVLFPLVAHDSRKCHALLDVLEKSLRLSFSAKYLLDRCFIMEWLASSASLQNMDLGSSSGLESGNRGGNTDVRTSSVSAKVGTRLLSLLRRAVQAAALSSNLSASVWCTLFMRLSGLIGGVVQIHSRGLGALIHREYLRLLVALMWDYSLYVHACAPTMNCPRFDKLCLASLVDVIHNSTSLSNPSEKQDVLLCVCAIQSFSFDVASTRVPCIDVLDILTSTATSKYFVSDSTNTESIFIVLPAFSDSPISTNANIFDYYFTPAEILRQVHRTGLTSDSDEEALNEKAFEKAWSFLFNNATVKSVLPTSLGYDHMLPYLAEAALGGLHGADDKQTISMCRWTLLNYAAFTRYGKLPAPVCSDLALESRISISMFESANGIAHMRHDSQLLKTLHVQLVLCELLCKCVLASKTSLLTKLRSVCNGNNESTDKLDSYFSCIEQCTVVSARSRDLISDVNDATSSLFAFVAEVFSSVSLVFFYFDKRSDVVQTSDVNVISVVDAYRERLGVKLVDLHPFHPQGGCSRDNEGGMFESADPLPSVYFGAPNYLSASKDQELKIIEETSTSELRRRTKRKLRSLWTPIHSRAHVVLPAKRLKIN